MEEKTDQYLGRIYLDQKDYSRIAKWLLGDSHFTEDLEAYQFLISLVESHKLLIYSPELKLTGKARQKAKKLLPRIPSKTINNQETQ